MICAQISDNGEVTIMTSTVRSAHLGKSDGPTVDVSFERVMGAVEVG